ncbi:mycofactocin biosynthesis peptidyl-dipeptidase MftE [Phytoactinopolyspora endophytica]|uniref:mycofactocin biosynthesis peptidyl-dipeptidase MftE n=1 Tax=Phytoactinopolyspora endophytica TaxID=1642495 RepID=UPI00197C2395|nr:mycofactocin biosynthesis peptidyl-dipeptidase MftE [Phytoactinopolyspora endophytica]
MTLPDHAATGGDVPGLDHGPRPAGVPSSGHASRLGDMTFPEAEATAAAGAVLAVPVGSTEQHGPHLPLSTDADLADALCRRLAEERADVVVAPVLAYGASGEHAGFAGTLSIGTEALATLLIELGRSAGETFGRMLIVSAHGGNAEAVARAASKLRAESRDVMAWTPRWTGDAHAGFVETSLQLALDGARVRTERAAAGATEPLDELMPVLRTGGVRAVSGNGVLGDPAGATEAEGKRVLDDLTAGLLAVVARWAGPATTGAPS